MTIIHMPRCFAPTTWGGTEAVVKALVEAAPTYNQQACIITSQAMDATPLGALGSAPIYRLPHSYGEWPLSAARRDAYDRKGGNLCIKGLGQRFAQQQPPCLVHLHTGGRLGAQALGLAKAQRWPTVLTLHGGHFIIPEQERHTLAATHLRKGIPWGKFLSWRWDTRHLLDHVDAIICVGIDEYQAVTKHYPKQRVELIPGGVDPLRFANADRNLGRSHCGHNGDRPLVGCLARLDAQKDQITLIKAWQQLRTPCDLVLIGGESTPGYRAQLERLATGGPGRVMFTGNVAPELVPHLLAACTILALPSIHEPFGLAVIEAWAARKPLVACSIGGPAWLMKNGAGLLVPPSDPTAFAAALERLLTDQTLQHAVIDIGTKTLAEHTWNNRIKQTFDLYESLLSRASL